MLPINDTQNKGIFAITQDNKLAYLTTEEYRDIKDTTSTIRLHVTDIRPDTYLKLKKLFGNQKIAMAYNFIMKYKK